MQWCICWSALSIIWLQMLFYVQLLIVETPSSTNTQSVLISTVLALVFGLCFLLLLSIFGVLVAWLCLRKLKLKESSEATNEPLSPLSPVYENPDALLDSNFQLSVHQDIAVTAAVDNVASSPSVRQNTDITTTDNVAYSTKLQALQDEEDDDDYI